MVQLSDRQAIMSKIPVYTGNNPVKQRLLPKSNMPLLELPVNVKRRCRSTSSAAAGECVLNNHALVAQNKVVKRRYDVCVVPKSTHNFEPGKTIFNFDLPNGAAQSKHRDPSPKVRCSGVQSKIAITKPYIVTRPVKVQRRKRLDLDSSKELPYVGDIYNMEYLEDIMSYTFEKEREILLDPNFLRTFSNCAQTRASALKWMQSLQGQINFTDDVLYLSVNIFDQIMARSPIRIGEYKLVLLTVLWMVNKLIGTLFLTASCLICYCDVGYLAEHMNALERFILKLLNYNIHTIEPSIVVNYYLKKFNITNIQLVDMATSSVLRAFTIKPEYSTFPCSLIGMAALTVVVKSYFQDLGSKLDDYFNKSLSVQDRILKRKLESLMG